MASYTTVHVGDVGTQFIVRWKEKGAILPITTATVMKIMFMRKSKNDVLIKDAQFLTNGTDGAMTCFAEEGDINVAGTWKMQGYIETPDWNGTSSIVTFTVEANLEPDLTQL